MGVAIYIACESEIDGVDTHVDGKSLARVDPDVLENIENQVGCRHIYDLMSFDPDELAEYVDELDTADAAPVEWFPASEGLNTVRGLRDHISKDPSAVPDANAVLSDLNDMEGVLLILDKQGVGFHFAVDV